LSSRRTHHPNMFRVFSHLKYKEGEGRQNHKLRHKNDGYKNRKKVKTMQAMWSTESDDSDINSSGAESVDDNVLNLDFMARVKEGSSTIDIDEIIASKNILDSKTIELLKNIAMSKNNELESQ
jgi:hypothetical protein